MSLHPMPLYPMFGRECVEFAPEIFVLDRLLVGGLPPLAFPGMDPLRNAFLHVERIGAEAYAALPLQRFQRADDGGKFHAIVGGGRVSAPELLLFSPIAQDRAPPAGSGIAAASAIRVDLDHVVTHDGSYGPVATPARAPGAARAPYARPEPRGARLAPASRRGSHKCRRG